MKKVRVKFLESIAGLADPKPKAELDEKYERIREENLRRERPLSQATVEERIHAYKQTDRYGEPFIGFNKDFGFKVGDEAFILGEIASKWEASGICVILPDVPAARTA